MTHTPKKNDLLQLPRIKGSIQVKTPFWRIDTHRRFARQPLK
jgi:hypothetical protein